MNIIWNIFKSNYYPNILQNAPNCTIVLEKNVLRGACTRTTLQLAQTQ